MCTLRWFLATSYYIYDAGHGMAWPPPPAEQIHHRNEIIEACRTQARYKLTVVVVVARDKHADDCAWCILQLLAFDGFSVRFSCSAIFSQCDFLHQWICTIMEEGLSQKNYLRLALRLRCGSWPLVKSVHRKTSVFLLWAIYTHGYVLTHCKCEREVLLSACIRSTAGYILRWS